jgi:hypothetical protein
MIELEACKNVSNCERVSYVAVTAFSHLALMGLLGIIVCSSHLINATGIKIGTKLAR